METKKILALIFILALVFRLAFALMVPVFDKPDEEQHFEYTEFVSEKKQIPVQTEGRKGEFYQPPFYHVFASFILSFVKIFTASVWFQVFSMRFLSIIVSMFTLYFIYRIASLVFTDKSLILGILAFASFLPSHINMNSTITNSNFGNLLSTIIIYLTLKVIYETKTRKNTLLLGLTTGISLITRLSTIPAILTIPFAFVAKHKSFKKIIKPLVLIAVIALILSGWHLVRNFILYGDFLGINALKLHSAPGDYNLDLLFIARLLGWTFITFWAAFGRTNGIFVGNLDSTAGIGTFVVFYSLLFLITLSSLYGLYKLSKKFMKNRNIFSSMQKKAFIILIVHLVILSASFFNFSLFNFQPQGRLFFPAISTISIFFTLGIYSLIRDKTKFLNIYMISFIALNIVSLLSLAKHYI